MRPSLLAFALLAVAAPRSHAQNPADIPPPKPPLVAPVPESFDWTITAKILGAAPPADPASHPPPRITEVHTVKTGKFRRDDIAFSDGTRSTHWIADQYLLWTSAQGQVCANDLRGAPGITPEDPDPTLPNTVPGVRWLQPSYFDKVVVVEKRPCYHFAHGESEAWLDVETRLPAAYKSGNVLYTYKYGAAPAQELTLPPEYQQAWDKIQQMLTRRRQPQPRGAAVSAR